MLFVAGFYFLYYGASLVIPMPSVEQEKMIKLTIIKSFKDRKKQQEDEDSFTKVFFIKQY